MSGSTASETAIAIVSAGAVTCVGLSAASTCAAIRASLDGFEETHFVDEVGEPLLGAVVPDEPLGLRVDAPGSSVGGAEKLAAMFVRAATECVTAVGGIDSRHTALLLVGPEASRPGFDLAKLTSCFNACQSAIGHSFHPSSRITQIGSPGLAAALTYAQILLINQSDEPAAAGEAPVHWVLVAGIDSLLNTEDINAALAQERLLSSSVSDGFVPGEAAACILVARLREVEPTDGEAQPRQLVLKVLGCGLADEACTLDANAPSRGLGLSRAMSQALQSSGVTPQQIHTRMSDISAESYFFEEASYAWTRVLRQRSPEGHSFTTPMNRIGHIGAAMGTLMLTLALDSARKGGAIGHNILLQLSSAGAPRGAVVVSTV